jgi:hypothetical protein
MSFLCTVCGERHDERPALAFKTPFHYDTLSPEEKEQIARVSSDFCMIWKDDQTDRFIRAVLFQAIQGEDVPLNYGVWVSLSERSFADYKANYDNDAHEATYFGFLCSEIPPYGEGALSVGCDVICKGDGKRPEVIPHDDQMEIAFVQHYYEGITREEADRRVHEMMSRQSG